MARKIGLGMPRREVLKVLAEGDVNEKKTSNYIGRIWSKGGNFDTIVSSPHTADFVVPDDGSEWTLASVKIVKVNAITINGGAVAEENIHLYPFFAVIDDADNLMFHFSSGSVIGVDEIKYDITCECTVSMKPESYRLITQKLSDRVSSLETGAGGSVDEEKVVEIVDQHLGYLQIQENITNLQDNVGEHENRLDEQYARILAIEGEDFANQGYVDQEIRYAIVEEAHSGLTTTNKTIVGAINEINAKESGGSGLVIGETEGTAYDGGKGFAVAADVTQLKIDVENLAGNLEGAVSTVNPMLENHESRISALEEGGSGGSSSGGDCACYGEPSIVLSVFMGTDITLKNLTGTTRIDWGDGTINDYTGTETQFTHTYAQMDMWLFYEIRIYGCTDIGNNAFANIGASINCLTINSGIKTIGSNAVPSIESPWHIPEVDCAIVFNTTVPPKIANVRYVTRDEETWEIVGDGDIPDADSGTTGLRSFGDGVTKIIVPNTAADEAFYAYWLSEYYDIIQPAVKAGGDGSFTWEQETAIRDIAREEAGMQIDVSSRIGSLEETVTSIGDRVTALEQGGGSSGGSSGEGESGGSEPSSGTKLYRIAGNAFENMGGEVECNFQAVVSGNPENIGLLDDALAVGIISITLIPKGNGFYPIGVVQDSNGTWQVYGFKDGNIITSTAGMLLNKNNIEEL